MDGLTPLGNEWLGVIVIGEGLALGSRLAICGTAGRAAPQDSSPDVLGEARADESQCLACADTVPKVVDAYLALEKCNYLGGYLDASGPVPVRLSFSPPGILVETMGEYWGPWLDVGWSEITDIRVEGAAEAQMRPSVSAVVAFGVLGLAARKREWSAVLEILTTNGGLVFDVANEAAPALRAKLEPFLSGVRGEAVEAGQPEDPTDLLAKLAALHRAGVLTDEEFEQKKHVLLDRI